MNLTKLTGLIAEFYTVVMVGLICGGGIGYIQGIVAVRSQSGGRWGLVEGTLVGVPLTIILYYFVLNRKIRFKEFLLTLFLCVIGGILSALILSIISHIITPVILIICALYIRFKTENIS